MSSITPGYSRRMGLELGVMGLMNIQYAIAQDRVYVLEVNPRASRTVPFVSKATGLPLAKIAARLMVGRKLDELGVTEDLQVSHCFVKAPVFPFSKFPGVDPILGPEMKSTGEVMGAADTFGVAYAKAQVSAGMILPRKGVVFISVNDRDKRHIAVVARGFIELGFEVAATRGTAALLEREGVPAAVVYKVNEGRPNVVDLIKSEKIDLILNTPSGPRIVLRREVHPQRLHSIQPALYHHDSRGGGGGQRY